MFRNATWPSGQTQVVDQPGVDRLVVVTEPSLVSRGAAKQAHHS
jgi:hypothetical protein